MKKFWLLLLIFTISACASKNPNFYQPVAWNEMQQIYPEFKQNILVDNVLLPASQTKPQITTLGRENYELKIDEFNRWGANPDKLIQQVINDDLSLIFPNAIIENKTTLRKNYKYAVWIEIQKMSGRLDENAMLPGVQQRVGRTKIHGNVLGQEPAEKSGYYPIFRQFRNSPAEK